MSESENVNFDPELPNRPVNAERILNELEPQPVAISRDELFFQAGFAAGSRRRAVGLFWPSAVAALVLVSCGLGAALVWQNDLLRSPLTLPSPTRGEGSELATNLQGNGDRDVGERFLVDPRQHEWNRLASAAILPPGRLTAMGWQELPPEMRSTEWSTGNSTQTQQSDSSAKPEGAPHRPATYLELMRTQREG